MIEEEKEEDLNLDSSDEDEDLQQLAGTKDKEAISQFKEQVPDIETKKVLGNIPKLFETMSIDDLPMDVKKLYQVQVNKLKSIRGFFKECFTNFTHIHSTHPILTTSLTSSLFSQLNHDAINCLMYILLDLYYSFFSGCENISKVFWKSLQLGLPWKRLARKVVKDKARLREGEKEGLGVMELVGYVMGYFREKIQQDEQIWEQSFVVYEQLVAIVWNSIFYIKLQEANFDEAVFKKILKQTVPLEKLEELTDEGGKTIESVELIDITMQAINDLQNKFKLPFPLNYYLFSKLSKSLFTSKLLKKEDIITDEEVFQIGNDLFAFMDDILNIKAPFDYIIWINMIFENFLQDYTDYTTAENKDIYSWLTIITSLLQKASVHSSKILKCRLISVDLLHVYKIHPSSPLDFTSINLQKLLFRLENSIILLPTLRITKSLLIDYKSHFENNLPTLKLILNVFKWALKLCHVFISDGFFENIFRTEILQPSGHIRVSSTLASFCRPFTLATKGLAPKEIALVEVVKGFNLDLEMQKKRYLPVFKNHLRKEKHFLGSYAATMKEMMLEDVKLHAHNLDFNEDPTSVEIWIELQKFDKLSYGLVMDGLRDQIDVWTSDKLSKIRRVVDRWYEHEIWEVDSRNKAMHSHSAVDLFKILFDTFDKIFDIIGERFFNRWHKTIKSMLDDVMFDYCSRLLDDIGDLYTFKKLFFLPNLNIKERKLSWPMMVSQRYKGKKIKLIFEEFYDEKYEIERIWLRLGSLDYLRTHLSNLAIRFLYQEKDSEKVLQTLDDYTTKVITVLWYKLTYCEFAQRIFNRLYFIDDTKKSDSEVVWSLEYLLPSIDDIMSTLHLRTSERMFGSLLPKLFEIFIELLIKYLKFYYQFVDYPELQEDQLLFKKEYKALLEYFVHEENKNSLTKKKAKELAKPFERFIQLVGMDEYTLVEEFKNAENEERQMISRILFRRKGKDANSFFNIYKSLIK
jgi:hypothetical protein